MDTGYTLKPSAFVQNARNTWAGKREEEKNSKKDEDTTIPNRRHTTDANWRVRDQDAQTAKFEAEKTIARRQGAPPKANGRMRLQKGPRTRSGVLFHDQEPGAIFWHYDERPCPDHHLAWPGWDVYMKPDGTWWRKKGRYWVVVEADLTEGNETVSEMPIFTNLNKGLARVKSAAKRKEYHSLCPKHLDPTNFYNHSENNPILEVAWMNHTGDPKKEEEGKLLRTTMVVHSTEVRKRSVATPELRLVGKLAAPSLDVLMKKET